MRTDYRICGISRRMKCRCPSVWLMVAVFLLLFLQASSQGSESKCTSQKTCSSCITAGPSCAWCKEDNGNVNSSSLTRCDTLNNIGRRCARSDIVYPQESIRLNKNVSLSQPGASVENMVQLMPQQVTLKIKPNSPQTFSVKFRQAKDYPVDLYYLMDLSNSMKDDKDKLAALGGLLGSTMGNITKNFQLGYGSFVDKKVAPFVSVVPSQLISPCTGCAAPYGFTNHMRLSEDTNRFATEVRNSRISGNLDTPEGSFDAMMQAVVCQDKIGWRNMARKILVVATDAGFHAAGDGKLGGIIEPNDGLCHLNSNGGYEWSEKQDYPSVSQIRNKIRENNVNVLFAVTQFAYPIFEELRPYIDGSHVGRLAGNSENIVDLVKEQYNKISSTVELKDTSPNNVRVTYQTSCLNPGGKFEKTPVCKGLKLGSSVDYQVTIEVTSCPKDPKNRTHTFQISPVGLSEVLTVHLELICECDCEQAANQEKNSPTCSRVGTYQCGICQCPPNHLGEFCQCDGQKVQFETDDTPCKVNNASIACSGRGTCLCGTCRCFRPPSDPSGNKNISGTYCECDNYSCPRHKNLLCSGLDRGECKCGHCECHPDWSGDACECYTNTQLCIGQSGEVCSGKGNCSCGQCICTPPFGGPFCEDNITPGGKCYDYRPCAQCAGFPKQAKDYDCKNCNYSIALVDDLGEAQKGEYKCAFKDDDGCNFFFVYSTVEAKDGVLIRVQKERECPVPVNVPLVISTVIGSIVAIGLALLLIFKLLTMVHDRREYAKFENERAQAKWQNENNPIYKEAVSKFHNPTYNMGGDDD